MLAEAARCWSSSVSVTLTSLSAEQRSHTLCCLLLLGPPPRRNGHSQKAQRRVSVAGDSVGATEEEEHSPRLRKGEVIF